MLSNELQVCLNEAFQSAKEQRHEFLTVEHALLAILKDPKVESIVVECGGKADELRERLYRIINTQPTMASEDGDLDVTPTPGFQRLLQRAVHQAKVADKNEVGSADILVSLLGEASTAARLLQDQGITRIDVFNRLSLDRSAPPAGNEPRTLSDVGIRPGDYYEDCSFHPCLCTKVTDSDIQGISLVDGSMPRSCDTENCGVRKLTLDECIEIKNNGPTDPADRDIIPPERRWWITGS